MKKIVSLLLLISFPPLIFSSCGAPQSSDTNDQANIAALESEAISSVGAAAAPAAPSGKEKVTLAPARRQLLR